MFKNYNILTFGLFSGLFLMLMSCQPSNSTDSETGNKYSYAHKLCKFGLLSKKEAALAVVTDTKEGFFDKITPLEIALILQTEKVAASKEAVMEDYRKKLQEDVQDFTGEEAKALSTLFMQVLDMCEKINPELNLPEIKLIKTAGSYYGVSVFYTRDNCIVIPGAQLASDALLKTLIHEVFHIYSRYNKDKRDSLYAAIGYQKINKLTLSPFLEKRILYNPDGVDIAYAIEVKDTARGQSIKAVPVIYSKFTRPQAMTPFHGHMLFQLFEVVEEEGGGWKVAQDGVGLSENQVAGYWEKIGPNTRYTIHPDEVLADNFTILARMKTNGDTALSKLEPEGKALLQKLDSIINQ